MTIIAHSHHIAHRHSYHIAHRIVIIWLITIQITLAIVIISLIFIVAILIIISMTQTASSPASHSLESERTSENEPPHYGASGTNKTFFVPINLSPLAPSHIQQYPVLLPHLPSNPHRETPQFGLDLEVER